MGYYKSLLTAANFGDREAMKTIAEDFENKGELKQAIKWYTESGNTSKVNKLLRRLENESDPRREEAPRRED